MISTKQILTIGMLAALAVVAASTVTFGAAFATILGDDNRDQGNDQDCDGTNCRNQQVNQENDDGDNNVDDVNFN